MPASQEYGDYRILASGKFCAGGGLAYNCTLGGIDASGNIRNKGGNRFFAKEQDSRFGADVYHNRISYDVRVVATIIDNKGTTVTFTDQSAARKDYSAFDFIDEDDPNVHGAQAYALQRININEGGFSKRWEFNYDYFQDNPQPQYAFDYRLRLTSIQKKATGTTTQPYEFIYYSNPAKSLPYLPWRLSKAVDKWGFYNGVTANNNLEYNIESICLPVNINGVTYTTMFGQSDRSSDNTAQVYGSLYKVILPEGGTIIFDMGSHTIYDPEAHITYQALSHPNPSQFATIISPSDCYMLSLLGSGGSEGTESNNTFTLTQDIYDSYCLIQGSVTCSGPEKSCDDRSGSWAAQLETASGAVIAFVDQDIDGCSILSNERIPFIELFPGLNLSYIGQSLRLKLVGYNSEITIKLYSRVATGENKSVVKQV